METSGCRRGALVQAVARGRGARVRAIRVADLPHGKRHGGRSPRDAAGDRASPAGDALGLGEIAVDRCP